MAAVHVISLNALLAGVMDISATAMIMNAQGAFNQAGAAVHRQRGARFFNV
jgi:hypothetical protein